jgi:HK97 family phage major capsid protein
MENQTYTKDQVRSLIDQAIAKERLNRTNIGHPDFLYGSKAEMEEKHEQALHIIDFFKAIQKKDDDLVQKVIDRAPQWYRTKAAFSEASNGAGQYTVPSFWSDMIFSNVERFGFARRLATVMPMPGKTVNLTTGGAVSVSWPGDNTAASAFDATNFFTQTPLVASTMAAAQIVQRELLQDSAVPLLQYLTEQVARAVAKEEDKQFFNGTGSPFTGIIGTSGINSTYQGNASGSGKTAFSNISWTDLVNLAQSHNTDAQENAAFFVSQAVYGALRQETSTSRPIWSFSNPIGMAGQQGISAITGNPVELPKAVWSPLDWPLYVIGNGVLPTSAANTTSVVFGNAQRAVLGVRQDLVMETFDQAYNNVDLAGQRQIALVSYERVAVGIPVPSAFGVLKTSIS